ncbi:MAG TPA: DJ-1/PfpI family protein [Polyangia bacterium]
MRTQVFAILVSLVAGGAHATEPRNVAIIVHEGVELLDFAGPGEVFSSAGNGAAFRVFTVGPTLAAVVSQGFVRITPDYSIANSPKPDILVIPGGRTTMLYNDPKMMAWLRDRVGAAEVTMSVCTGAIALARAGLLDGLHATTHYGALASLRKFPHVTVDADARFVDNGRIITTQGVSAGIDGALHVVERLLGSEAAWSDARYMMYHWEPASLTVAERDELRPYVEQDWTKVAAVYRKKLDANGKDADAARRLGIAETELHDYAHAVVTLERAVSLGIKDPDVLDELGDSQAALGHFREAARAYERELPLRSSLAQPFVAVNAAKAWTRAGDKQAAITILSRYAAKLDRASLRELGAVPELASLRGDARFDALVREPSTATANP